MATDRVQPSGGPPDGVRIRTPRRDHVAPTATSPSTPSRRRSTARRRALADHPWVWLRQVHGAEVVIGHGGQTPDHGDRRRGRRRWSPPSPTWCWPCRPPTASRSRSRAGPGCVGVAHAGWRGLEAGVVEADGRRRCARSGHESIGARVGPCIAARSATSSAPPTSIAWPARFGHEVRASTSGGHAGARPRPVAVGALRRRRRRPAHRHRTAPAGAPPVAADRGFSHRARAEPERMATVIWRERPTAGPGRRGSRDRRPDRSDRSVPERLVVGPRPHRGRRRRRRGVDLLAVTKGFGPEAVARRAGGRPDRGGRELRPGAAGQGGGPGRRPAARWPRSVTSPSAVPFHRPPPAQQGAGRWPRWWRCGRPSTAPSWRPRSPVGRPAPAVLVQLNLSGRAAEGRLRPGRAPRRWSSGAPPSASRSGGLMGVGPAGPPEAARPGFRRLVALADRLGLPDAVDRHERRPRGGRAGGIHHGAGRVGTCSAPARPRPDRLRLEGSIRRPGAGDDRLVGPGPGLGPAAGVVHIGTAWGFTRVVGHENDQNR